MAVANGLALSENPRYSGPRLAQNVSRLDDQIQDRLGAMQVLDGGTFASRAYVDRAQSIVKVQRLRVHS